MRKTLSFILCAIIFVIGALGTLIEIGRMVDYGQTMIYDQWVGEILMMIIYLATAIGSMLYAIRLWHKKNEY